MLNDFESACGLRLLFLHSDAMPKRIYKSYLDLKNESRDEMTKVGLL